MKTSKDPKMLRKLQYSSVGIEFGASIVAGLLIGQYLDERFGLTPYMTIFWTFAGIANGYRSLFRLITKVKEEQEDNNQDKTKSHD